MTSAEPGEDRSLARPGWLERPHTHRLDVPYEILWFERFTFARQYADHPGSTRRETLRFYVGRCEQCRTVYATRPTVELSDEERQIIYGTGEGIPQGILYATRPTVPSPGPAITADAIQRMMARTPRIEDAGTAIWPSPEGGPLADVSPPPV